MKVDDEFLHSDKYCFHGKRSGNSLGLPLHSMVMVGHRKENGKELFLLQNWWHTKPFVEVTIDYLQTSCGAYVHVVKTPQLSLGSFATGEHAHVEVELLDVQEMHTPETCC